jgi:natural product biosynthesis luciferase-like monooxygenase protein
MVSQQSGYHGAEVAVIGMAGRFPGACSVDAFWHNLAGGVESTVLLGDVELEPAGHDRVWPEATLVKSGGVLDDVDLFDAEFFDYSPNDAEIMDPQHRVFLECASAALENAGYDSYAYDGLIGVYAGSSLSSYLAFHLWSRRDVMGSVGRFRVLMGNDKDFLTTRVSYKLNLRGPSVTVQTACSTSLAAVHMACQALINGECDIALAGGVCIRLPQKSGYHYEPGGILSPDGHCRPFDADANGTVFGNGVGVIVLRRLIDAIACRDSIRAVIKGSAMNNDGNMKAGYAAPSTAAQANVIRAAHAAAAIDPITIGYIEAHGTGTPLGDAIELDALLQVFGSRGAKRRFCGLGSVKANIGHLDAAAGVAGLIKTVLMLEHSLIPPAVSHRRPVTQLKDDNSPFYINHELRQWAPANGLKRASVSAFGMGGTNVHVVVEQAPEVHSVTDHESWQLLVMSAKTPTALEATTASLIRYLEEHPAVNLADVAYTYQVGRRGWPYRRIAVCYDVPDAVATLGTLDPNRVSSRRTNSGSRSVIFVFPHLEVDAEAVARELYDGQPSFRREIDRCAEPLQSLLRLDVRECLSGHGYVPEAHVRCWRRVAPFLTAYALAGVWSRCGVRPYAVVGHGSGHLAAGCVAGVISFADAVALLSAGNGEEVIAQRAAMTGSSGFLGTDVPGWRTQWADTVRFVSLTGEPVTARELTDPEYWMAALRNPPRAVPRLPAWLQRPGQILLAIDPCRSSSSMTSNDTRASSTVPIHHDASACWRLLEDLGQVWLEGVSINWEEINAVERRGRIGLPTYPFERRRYWISAPAGAASPTDHLDETAVSVPSADTTETAHAVPVSPTAELERDIAAMWQRMFSIEVVGAHDDFFDLGGDSVIAIQLATTLSDKYQIDLGPPAILNARTVSKLAAMVSAKIAARRHPDDIVQLLTTIEQLSPEAVHAQIAEERSLAEQGRAVRWPPAPLPAGDRDRVVRLSVFFFGADDQRDGNTYADLLDIAQFADRHDFAAIWTPERHFQSAGGLFPNPSVLGAALAMVTRRIDIRAGSVVLPLHDPIRVAEEWAVVDNLSGGRVGVSFASGWHPLDFVLVPDRYAVRKDAMFHDIEIVQRLWRGETVMRRGVDGSSTAVSIQPRPLQLSLPVWITTSGDPDTWVRAGEIGANVLGAMMTQPLDQLAVRISAYRQARARSGVNPETGQVCVMLHTFTDHDDRSVRQHIDIPLKNYLRSHLRQIDGLNLEAFVPGLGGTTAVDSEAIIELAYEHYLRGPSLLGTPTQCARTLKELAEIGVDEVACFVDFGLDVESVKASLERLESLARELPVPRVPQMRTSALGTSPDSYRSARSP